MNCYAYDENMACCKNCSKNAVEVGKTSMPAGKRSREQIQAFVDTLSGIEDGKGWQSYLFSAAARRKALYHYTTFQSLRSILRSKEWHVSRMDSSNDPTENKIYSISFSRGLETVAMWGKYSRPAGNGVRIKFNINSADFKKCFHLNPDSENPGTMMDVAYYYPGTNNSKCLLYDGIKLWGNSIKWNVPSNHLPCFLKNSIWYDENETRIIYRYNDGDPQKLTLSLKDFDFSKLEFDLAPDFLCPERKVPDEETKNRIIEKIFGDLLSSRNISPSQFKLSPHGAVADLSKRRKNLFRSALNGL